MCSELPVDCLKSPMPVHVMETHVAPIIKTEVQLQLLFTSINQSIKNLKHAICRYRVLFVGAAGH